MAARKLTNPKLVIHSRVTDIVSAGVYWWTMECEGDTVAHSIGEFTQAEIENFVKWLSTDLGIPYEYAEDDYLLPIARREHDEDDSASRPGSLGGL